MQIQGTNSKENSLRVKDFEFRAYRKNGTAIYVSISARAIRNEDQNFLYYEGNLEDIHKWHRSEKASYCRL